MKKIFVLVFLVFLLSFVSAQCSYYLLDVDTDYTSLPGRIFPGDRVSLSVGVENTTESCSVRDITASLILNEKYFEPLSVSDNISVLTSNETKSAIFTFNVKKDTLPGTYKIPVKLQYINLINPVEETFDLVLDVEECFSLDIDNVYYSVESVYVDEPLKIFADVKNSCSGVARDVQVELKPVTNSTFDPFIVLSSSLLQVGDILPGKSVPISFSLKPIKSAQPQIYVFEIDANCFDCEKTYTDKVSFEVLAKPDLIFSGLDFSNETRSDSKTLFAGDVFSFSVQIDNIGKEAAKAVKVSLIIDEEIVGSKEDFIGNIDPDDSGAAIFDLTVLPTAKEGEHNATIVVDYINEVDLQQQMSDSYKFYVNSPPSDIGGLVFLLILIIIVLVVLYFIIKMVFRQLALRKAKLR